MINNKREKEVVKQLSECDPSLRKGVDLVVGLLAGLGYKTLGIHWVPTEEKKGLRVGSVEVEDVKTGKRSTINTDDPDWPLT